MFKRDSPTPLAFKSQFSALKLMVLRKSQVLYCYKYIMKFVIYEIIFLDRIKKRGYSWGEISKLCQTFVSIFCHLRHYQDICTVDLGTFPKKFRLNYTKKIMHLETLNMRHLSKKYLRRYLWKPQHISRFYLPFTEKPRINF